MVIVVNITIRNWMWALGLLCMGTALPAGVIYSGAELKTLGDNFEMARTRYRQTTENYDALVARIDNANLSPSQKANLKNCARRQLEATSKRLAVVRDQVQRAVVVETNARMGVNPYAPVDPDVAPVTSPVQQTAGTDINDPKHRGWKGDLDAGAGAQTTERMKEVLADMDLFHGPNDPRNRVDLSETAGVIDVKGEFELTVNKTGMQAQPGTEYHQIQTEVNANHKETYISEGMKTRDPTTGKVTSQQAGADYVTIQDHKKKAIEGMKSPDTRLASNDEVMQGMAKGASKAIADGGLSNQELNEIARRHGLGEDGGRKLRQQLDDIKTGKHSLRGEKGRLSPEDAAKLREATKDIFAQAEAKTLAKGRQDIADLKARIETARARGDMVEAQRLQNELVDSRVKMQETHRANQRKLDAPERARLDVDGPPRTVADVDGGPPKGGVDAPEGAGGKALKTVGAIMTIADIGNACQILEDYNAGKITGEQAAEALVDQTIALGLIGAYRKVEQSTNDWWAANKSIHQANKMNLVNFFQQWELELRRAEVPAEEARRLVGDAMASGDTKELELKAFDLRAQGWEIKAPTLIVDTVEADDTVWQRTGDTLYGMGAGIANGVEYIVTAPYRTVMAWAEGEIAEADLELRTADQVAYAKSRLFRRLKDYGFGSQEALDAINRYFDGTDPYALKRIFKEIRARRKYLTSFQRQQDWYCTNRPVIKAPVKLPPILGKK